ncbi:MAG: hypothetical protein KME42_27990 [Tildeniella nuda ZEHNDER 1965/U140]|jgi:hypothetical protein|nr:hypothetical protein [Tildeniella nuda ZEHNDER 1965/U140]
MPWKLEDAKQKFSELIHAAVEEPQLIYDQNQLVVAVVKADVYQEFLVWQQQSQKPALASAFTELRELCIEENYLLEMPPHIGNTQYSRF